MNFRSSFFTVLCFILAASDAAHALTYRTLIDSQHRIRSSATSNTQARLQFNFYIEFQSQQRPSKRDSLLKIDEQLLHLYGPMAVYRPKAAPKGQYDVQIQETEKLDHGFYRVTYTFDGLISLQTSQNDRRYQVYLPIRPAEIYKHGLVGQINLCTDEYYNTEFDFWYFWNPKKKGCPLISGKDYEAIDTRIYRYKNNDETYPEYERLVDLKTHEISVVAFFGMDEPDGASRNPNISKDINAENFNLLKNQLLKAKFTRERWTQLQTENYLKGLAHQYELSYIRFTQIPYVEEFTRQTPKGVIRVRAVFGATGIEETSRAFHYLYKEALETAAIIIYDGHSGLGSHLDLDLIGSVEGFKIKLPRERYQIYFFNSCSSFSYYNDSYFVRKASRVDLKGTHNLDILAAGLETEFAGGARGNGVIISAILQWALRDKALSYQTLLRKMDSGNLLSVNGDEDNPLLTHP